MTEAPVPSRKTVVCVAALAFLAGAAGVVVGRKFVWEGPVLVHPDAFAPEELAELQGAEKEETRAVVAANESAAVAALRSIAAAQETFQVARAIDTDDDDAGEFGFLAELAGTAPLRIHDPETGGAALGAPEDLLDPPFLLPAFGEVQPDGTGRGVVQYEGYCFKVFLPGETVDGETPGRAEAPRGGTSPGDVASGHWSADNCEVLWCAYAWPIEVGETGTRAFMTNQDGQVVQYENPSATYEGLGLPPRFDAAFDAEVPRCMNRPLGLKSAGRRANDGNLWTIVRN